MGQLYSTFYETFRLDIYAGVFEVLWFFAPVWVPLTLSVIFLQLWLTYRRSDYILKQGFSILEIKLPREIDKSPAAMEIFFSQLYQTGAATELETYFDGKVRPWFSFELVSLEGKVKFFIWTHAKWKDFVEAQLYAQYPTIELHEVPDYTTMVHHDLDKWSMWITYFMLEKPDPYPIKTYVDYGLDKDPKEEHKVEPMSSVIEYLGSLKKGEYAWIQILIQAHKKEKFKDGRILGKEDWRKAGLDLIEKIKSEGIEEVKDPEGKIIGKFTNLTSGQQDAIKAIERSLDKYPFEVAIRGAYIAKNEAFRPISINGLIGSFRQYSSVGLNGFKLGSFTDFDYPWQDFKRKRRNNLEKTMLEAYKRRSYFQPPFKNYLSRPGKPFILTTEELATIYHMPGGVVQTPTFDRIASKKSEAPANLPI
ncbi:MAG: hypothetical protein COV70_00945 [Parcubacteria group bacterium CG11_big_fil_rev_8_21_14_0_20_39_22]|nr:MAG: hypothetical protein COV70_00945 [Parcubacteria group bacterium CG11_big_fil_rev_8_21_14_0_20_39_22]